MRLDLSSEKGPICPYHSTLGADLSRKKGPIWFAQRPAQLTTQPGQLHLLVRRKDTDFPDHPGGVLGEDPSDQRPACLGEVHDTERRSLLSRRRSTRPRTSR